MNELNALRGLVAEDSARLVLGTVTEIPSRGRVVVRMDADSYRKAYGQAALGDRVLLRNDQILRVIARESTKDVYVL